MVLVLGLVSRGFIVLAASTGCLVYIRWPWSISLLEAISMPVVLKAGVKLS